MKIKNLIEGLNAQQRSVPQLPAQARAKKISVLGAKTDPKHPFAGYAVGADESAEPGRKSIGPDQNDPYEKGWRAGFRHNESNPYPAGSEKAAQWDKGYAEAEAQPDYYDEEVDLSEKLGTLRPKLGTGHDVGKSVRKWRKQRGLSESDTQDKTDSNFFRKFSNLIAEAEQQVTEVTRRGFLKSLAGLAASVAVPTPVIKLLSTPAGVSTLSITDGIALLKGIRDHLDQWDAEDDDDYYEAWEDMAAELGFKSTNDEGEYHDPVGDLLNLYRKNPEEAAQQLIKHIQSKVITPKDVKSSFTSRANNPGDWRYQARKDREKDIENNVDTSTTSIPGLDTPGRMSSLARAAGAQIGRTMSNVGKATAKTVLNQPARDMGQIEPTTAPAALPAPTVSPGMQIPKQKSRVAAKQDKELGEAVAEEFDSDNNPWSVTDVDPISETDFEVALKGPGGQQLNFVIRPVDFMETRFQQYQIDTMDVRDLQSGKTMHWGSMNDLGQWLPIFDAIDTYFWESPTLQAKLEKIIDYYMDAGEQGKNPDLMPGLDQRPPNGVAVSADDFIASHNTTQDALAKMKKGVAEGKWNYPPEYTKKANADDEDELKVSLINKDARKAWRKKQKAKAHKDLMTGKKKEPGVAEATGDPKFDKMLKGITGKKAVAKQQKTDTKQQARDAFSGMFGGGNPADSLGIRKKDVSENWGEPLAGWHIVYARTGNKVSGTPEFDSKESAQKYLMTKMSANHHNYRVADADNLGTSAPTPMGGYLEEGERNEMDTPAVQAALRKMAERHRGEKWSKEQLAALGKRIAARGQNKKGVDETVSTHKGGKITKTPTGIKHQAAPGNYGGYEPEFDHLRTLDKHTTGRIERSMDIKHKREKAWQGGIELDEAVTKEDIITKLKAKLGDYLSDIGQEIRKDPALIDKLSAKAPGDQMGPPVKTVTTDDGHEISIHGNEDDGFRISIKNKQSPSQFNNLDEAVMACEMYCAHRRTQALNADYVEEA